MSRRLRARESTHAPQPDACAWCGSRVMVEAAVPSSLQSDEALCVAANYCLTAEARRARTRHTGGRARPGEEPSVCQRNGEAEPPRVAARLRARQASYCGEVAP